MLMSLSRFMKNSVFVPKNSKKGSYHIQYVPEKSILGTCSTKMCPKIKFRVRDFSNLNLLFVAEKTIMKLKMTT